ncbi:LacI family transcriptional regulator [Phytoactinopolyspora alkaliphila]|uniref:LacI family transcriptional regulator n=2 Tax=Phytoactinopolyspora alkaliphila TaxID=1783498 RepID=A0A6N9YP16_9ACTN|nr:LacI family transcriptional regulator [Phytoactinopolyspora alkaliphila]
MREVAERAGVSIATVSFVVNNTKPVSPATRERIEAAMAELGFRRNVVARALASRRTRILAMAYPALQHRLGSTAMSFVTSAASAASEREYHLVLWPVDNDGVELTELIRQGLVDGIVLMEVLLDDARVDALISTGTPYAMIGRTADPAGLPYVDIDFDATVDTALDHLQSLGHREIAFVSERPPSEEFRAYGAKVRAEAAFRGSCERRGLEPIILECAQNAAGGRKAAGELLQARPRTTAVVIMNEHAAFGVVSGLARSGVRVPEDVSLLSVSTSSDMGAMADPVLTIMRSPGIHLGRLAVQLLLSQLDGGEAPSTRLLPCELHQGESTAPARVRG